MSVKAYKNIGKRNAEKKATQGTKLEGQVKNHDGAYVYKVDDWNKLDRFLFLGTENGSYYASEKKLTKESVKNILKLLELDGKKVVDRVVEISLLGSAPKNDQALFVLALASADKNVETRRAAFNALSKVARIGTHLFHFVEFREQFAGWGKGMRKAISSWYGDKDLKDLSFQLGKYQSRDGWSNRDLLRLSHANPKEDENRSTIYKWVVSPKEVNGDYLKVASPILSAFDEIKSTDDEKRILELVTEFKLPLEMIPTDKRSRKVYEVMLNNFGITALIRNLGKLSECGILDSGNFSEVNKVVNRLTNVDEIKKGRVHPISTLMALLVYKNGKGVKGDLTWKPNPKIIDALNEAFYLGFDSIESTGKNIMLALDVSGSMNSPIGGTFLTCREASAAMAMAVAKTEKNYLITSFSSKGNGYLSGGHRFYDKSISNDFFNVSGLTELNITNKTKLPEVMDSVNNLDFTATDCSLPMRWALKNKIKFDAFVVYTDNETNCYNQIQPSAALKRYREEMGIDAKLIVNAMTVTDFTIADPNDKGMLDCIGFSSDTPQVISRFIKNEF